ncbi:MAG: glycosyltransferase [Verrucomicrobiaceae bacterium]
MDEPPRVSVIIPTWNWSSALRCSIPTVLWQTFTDFELLVIGDGCTDDSVEVVASFTDKRVRWHNLPQNAGHQFAPNNAGMAMARGEYIAYLGHDDLWLPEHLASLVAVADETGSDLAFSGILMIGPQQSGKRAVAGLLSNEGDHSGPVFTPPSAILHRRDVGVALGGWRPPNECVLPPDMDFFRRCWDHRSRVVGTGRISVIKFNASWRTNSYLIRDTSDQTNWLERIRSEKGFLERELHETLACFLAGRLTPVGDFPALDIPKGEIIANARRIRGLEGEVGVEIVPDGIRFTAEHPGLLRGWHPPEVTQDHGCFRWSGPETAAICEFNNVPISSRILRIGVAHTISEETLSVLTVTVNGVGVPLRRGWVKPFHVFECDLPSSDSNPMTVRMEIIVPKTSRPSDVSPHCTDQRRLGIALAWVEFLELSAGACSTRVMGESIPPTRLKSLCSRIRVCVRRWFKYAP